jgi:hypothetical protein
MWIDVQQSLHVFCGQCSASTETGYTCMCLSAELLISMVLHICCPRVVSCVILVSQTVFCGAAWRACHVNTDYAM